MSNDMSQSQSQLWKKENPERVKENTKAYYHANKEVLCKKNQNWRSNTYHCVACDKDMTNGARAKHNKGKTHLKNIA